MPTVENLRYPTSTDTPDVPRDVRQLAEDVVARTPYASHATKVTVTTTGSPATGNAAVNFPAGKFSSAPGAAPIIVVATLASGAGGTQNATVRVTGAATAADATVALSNITTAGAYEVNVVAVQETP